MTASSYTQADLDSITGGVFHAATSGERAALLRAWLEKQPSPELMQAVFTELAAKDKGAAKVLREKLDEIKRSKTQNAIAEQWAEKAQALLAAGKLHIADAMAWQRDAAKAGAPLSKAPLAELKEKLAQRIKQIEELQHQAQVQREAAMMLLQRLDMLSTKAWAQADSDFLTLQSDAQAWRTQTLGLQQQADWTSLDPKYPAQLDAALQQTTTMFDAFAAALASVKLAASDASAPLPQLPVWAEEIRLARGLPAEMPAAAQSDAGKQTSGVAPEERKAATAAVRAELRTLEKELEEGHGKASLAAANAVRAALKTHGALIDAKTDLAAQAALAAAAELEGWQRWRANQIRDELIAKAQALVNEALPGRKQQEAIRQLREAWKQTDQGGMANHGAWKHFDEACNAAHQVVDAWLVKVRAQEAQVKTARDALLAEVKSWTEAHASSQDWRSISRDLRTFAQRWREAGHLGEKLYTQYQNQWKTAIKAAHAGIEAAQKTSMAARNALIAEAKQLAAQAPLRIDAVKALQSRWQAEAQSVPLERKTEQKLWDAFREPIDAAFARKSEAREKAQTAASAHDQSVLAAVSALDAANASGDAGQIRAAMAALQAAVQQAPALATPVQLAESQEPAPASAAPAAEAETATDETAEAAVPAAEEGAEAGTEAAPAAETAPPPAPVVKKAVVAMRGDDRPGAQRQAASTAGRGGSAARERDGKRRESDSRGARNERGLGRRDEGRGAERRSDFRGNAREQAPRLSNQAFYAQREALDRAQAALKKLSMQAHGESIVQLLGSWQARDAQQLPPAVQLSKNLSPQVRSKWASSLAQGAQANAPDTALLRLEMAADVPTPAEHLAARRQLQLQLLTQRNQAAPTQTWGDDVAAVLASGHAEASAKRLQAALAKLLRA